jgi:hypothetical protein
LWALDLVFDLVFTGSSIHWLSRNGIIIELEELARMAW